MKIRLLGTSGFLAWLLIISVSVAFITVIVMLAVNAAYKPEYNGEALKYFDRSFLERSAGYNKTVLAISIARKILAWIFTIAAVAAAFKYLAKTPRIPIAAALALIAAFYILLQLTMLPLDFWRGFIVEHNFGLSDQAAGMWFADFAKSWAISFLINTAALTGVYALIIFLPKYWWVVSIVVMIIFIIIGSYLYPLIIDPLFYNFKKLEEGSLRDRVIDISEKAGIEVKDVLVADASRRTNKANAYFSGLGSSRRVVLFDTLINDFTEKEVLSVVAHEIGHWYHKHIIKSIIASAAAGILALFAMHLIIRKAALFGDFKAIAVIILLVSVFTFIALPMQNTLSRYFEKQTDETALKLTGDPGTQISLMARLATTNLSNVEPHPFIKVFLYGHPSILERIKLAEQYDSSGQARKSP